MAASLIFYWTGEVSSDYGQFALFVRGSSEEADDFGDAVDYSDVVDAAINGVGLAQWGPVVVVLSPHQTNFSMPFEIEVWDRPVSDDMDEWEEVFVVWLDVDADGLEIHDPEQRSVSIPVPSGRYRTVVGGRDFVHRGWPGTTRPGDRWRMRMSPDDRLGTPAHIKTGPFGTNPLGPATPVTGRQPADAQLEISDLGSGTEGTIEPAVADRKTVDHLVQDALDAVGKDDHARLARVAARRACHIAGIETAPWVHEALAALDASGLLPPSWDDSQTLWMRLYTDEGIPETVAIDPGTGGQVHQQTEAVESVLALRAADPTEAANRALRHLVRVAGPGGYAQELETLTPR